MCSLVAKTSTSMPLTPAKEVDGEFMEMEAKFPSVCGQSSTMKARPSATLHKFILYMCEGLRDLLGRC